MSDLLQILCLYLQLILYVSLLLEIRDLRVVWSVECALYRVAVKNIELSEDNHSGSGLLGGLVGKLAIWERKHLVSLPKHVRDEPDQVIVLVLVYIILWAGATIHKDVALPGVTVKITIEQDGLVVLRT